MNTWGEQLGQTLRMLRKRERITQLEMGKRIGVTRERIRQIENNAATLTVKRLSVWCAVVGESPGKVIRFVEVPINGRQSLISALTSDNCQIQ